MLDAIKKKLGISPAATEAVADATESLNLVVDASAVSTELSVMRTEFEAGITKRTSEFEAARDALAEMTVNFETAQAALNALSAEKAELAISAETAKTSARKAKVVMAIGTEKADGLMLATQGLEDAAFDAVISALAGSVDAEAKTSLFTESGVEAEADTAKLVVENPTAKLIRQKYPRAI